MNHGNTHHILENNQLPLTPMKHLQEIFERQVENASKVRNTKASERRAKLKKLERTIFKYREEIKQALVADFSKSPVETDLSEIIVVLKEIRFARKKLKYWMADQAVPTTMLLTGTRSWIRYEAKGVALIISPWNFPINLTFCPLISAIAAGNCCVVKPSEFSSNASAIIKKVIEEVFQADEVAVVEGDHNSSAFLTSLPFNHIFFTGSTFVGKQIMKAAAENLCSVTLELGGKSPTIVDESANIKQAAMRIVWAKFMNAGQTCIAPDYILVQESRKEELIKALKHQVELMYEKETTIQLNEDFARLIRDKHFSRIESLLDDARSKGAILHLGGEKNRDTRQISPIILSDVSPDAEVLKSEIFGPLLPIIEFSDLDEAIAIINSKPRPLALYLFSGKNKNINKILDSTNSGTTAINDSLLQFFNSNLPFGGVNHSGIGKSHGHFGFLEFSNQRSVLRRTLPVNAMNFIKPPFSNTKKKLVDFALKWL